MNASERRALCTARMYCAVHVHIPPPFPRRRKIFWLYMVTCVLSGHMNNAPYLPGKTRAGHSSGNCFSLSTTKQSRRIKHLYLTHPIYYVVQEKYT